MPAKVIITGYPVGKLMGLGKNIYCFFMKEGGTNMPSPKGFEPTEAITYAVYLNLRMVNRTNLKQRNLSKTLVQIEGDVTLSFPHLGKGKIGVICRKLIIVSDLKQQKQQSMPLAKVKLDQIEIPELFLQSTPNSEKIQSRIQTWKQNGKFDEPIILKEGNILVDGYTKYLAAIALGLEEVEVSYEAEKISSI